MKMRRFLRGHWLTLFVAFSLTSVCCAVQAESPDPMSLLQKFLQFVGERSSIQVVADVDVQIKMMGQKQDMSSVVTIRMQKPDQLSIVSDGGPMSLTLIADGERVVQYVPMLHRYTVSESGDASEASMMTGGVDVVDTMKSYDAQKAYSALEKLITEATYLGTEKLGDVECHHCRYEADAVSVDVWFESGERPLVYKIVPDLTKALAQQAEAQPAIKEMSVEYSVSCKDWTIDAKLTDADFAFSPPEDAEKVDSLFAGFGNEARAKVHPLVGGPAPQFTVANLDGADVSIADHLGKDVVILDFWATWCGPCVAALPVISEVAAEFSDRGVVFYAVNLGDDKQTVTDFLAEKKLQLPVLLDTDSSVGGKYRASAIPQTVLIGKDGRVQIVHVGFGGDMKPLLRDELERLLQGEDLAAVSLAEAEAAEAKREEKLAAAANTPKLDAVWDHPGQWNGVAVDPKTRLAFTSSPDGSIDVLNAKGKKVAAYETAGAGSILRLAELQGDGSPELLTFSTWSSDLLARSVDGAELWKYPQGQGIDDVWSADLDGDGRDEVIVGFNGETGLHVLESDGNVRWKNTDLGNVWHVSAGDLDGDGAIDVVSTSAQGALHVFSADGNTRKDIEVPIYASIIRTASLDGDGQPAVAIVTGSGDNGEAMLAVDFAGKTRWQTPLPHLTTPHADSLAVAPSRPWAAVGMRDGLVHVVDLSTGTIVAHVGVQGQRPEVVWMEREEQPPLLLVADGEGMTAFDVAAAIAE